MSTSGHCVVSSDLVRDYKNLQLENEALRRRIKELTENIESLNKYIEGMKR